MELIDMRFVKKRSIYYRIIGGENEGRFCAVLDYEVQPNGLLGEMKVVKGKTRIAFTERRAGEEEVILEKVKNLLQREIPGWDDRVPDYHPVGFKEFLKEWGNGSNRLRTATVAQPHTIRLGDFLATGSQVIAGQRWGYNSSILLKISKFGWVELASRLPIALSGSKINQFKIPIELKTGDILATTCEVTDSPKKISEEWVIVPLNDNALIDIPSCMPIALKN